MPPLHTHTPHTLIAIVGGRNVREMAVHPSQLPRAKPVDMKEQRHKLGSQGRRETQFQTDGSPEVRSSARECAARPPTFTTRLRACEHLLRGEEARQLADITLALLAVVPAGCSLCRHRLWTYNKCKPQPDTTLTSLPLQLSVSLTPSPIKAEQYSS